MAALVNPKARLWVKGRKKLFQRLEQAILEKDPRREKQIAWFHCASLGEFEQGRPVIEAYRRKHPEQLSLITFFSPSGYEIRKNYTSADFICYLPSDTKAHAEKFVRLVKPSVAIFIKYEYWFNYLSALQRNATKVYVISAIFRQSQHFFRWYGSWFRKQLSAITWFFVQDDESLRLLKSIGILQASVSGDTRFDRVFDIRKSITDLPLVRSFCGDAKVMVAGSTWPEDENLLLPLIRQGKMKFILAPHETDKARIQSLIEKINLPVLKYSEADPEKSAAANIMIIDSIGILSRLYRYATVAYIGGGFGAGIHNILEAATFGVPILFGPNYRKFREANDLIRLGGAFSVENETRFSKVLETLTPGNPIGTICSNYVDESQGATQHIMEQL